MNLSRNQKKFIKKNIKKLPLSEISAKLNLSENELLRYLKENWQKDKFEKLISRQKTSAKVEITTEMADKTAKGFWWRNWKIFLFLGLIILIVYLNSLGNEFISDDITSISKNPDINSVVYFWKTPYYNLNLRLVINFVIYHLFGLNPAPFRLFNIFIHIGSAWLVYLLLKFFYRRPIPLFAAGIFAVHPLLTESVSWISGGPYSNSAFFLFLSLLFYIYHQKKHKTYLYIFSLLAFIISLLISQKIVVFPAIIILYEILFGDLRNWKRLLPFVTISGFWTLNLIGLMGERISALESTFYVRPGIDNPLIQIPVAISSYLELALWPQRLSFYHSEMVFAVFEYVIRVIVFIVFTAFYVFSFKKDKKLFFWLSFFIICLLPTLTPFRISWVVAERYINPAAIGIFLLIALAISSLEKLTKIKNSSYIIFGLILIVLGSRTIIRNSEWKTSDRFWFATAKYSPSSYQNHNNLADVYFRHQDYDNAEKELKIAIALKPNYGDAYHNLGNVYYSTKRYDQAIESYKKSLSFNPNIWQSHQNLSVIYFEKGDYFLAKQEIDEALKINPNGDDLYLSLGILYTKLNEPTKAREALEQALRVNPANERAKQGLLSLP